MPARRGGEGFRTAFGPAFFVAWLLGSAPVQAQAPQAGHSPYFLDPAPWTQDVSAAPLDAESSTIIGYLSANGVWMNPSALTPPARLQIDFSIEVLEATASTPYLSFVPTDDWYDPDCDQVSVPVPANGAIEGESGYACLHDGDCHLLVVDRAANRLFEMWRADIDNTNTFYGGCLAVWDLRTSYQPSARGQDCTSADAAGFPIAPLLFNADEVKAGHIDHALRYILPNSRIRHYVYVHPSTHSTGPTGGPAQAPPYGARLRLKSSFNLDSLPNEGARTIARAMQKYGILLSDGGSVGLTAQSDQFTTAKWDDALVLGTFPPGYDPPLALRSIKMTDFEVAELGQRFTYTGDCARTFPLFGDGFEAGLTPKWNAKTP